MKKEENDLLDALTLPEAASVIEYLIDSSKRYPSDAASFTAMSTRLERAVNERREQYRVDSRVVQHHLRSQL